MYNLISQLRCLLLAPIRMRELWNYLYLDYFFSIDSFERNTKINKDGNYSIDINLKQVFDYLVERKLVKNTDIVPGIEVTTEIWDGIGEMKIKKLKYEIVKE